MAKSENWFKHDLLSRLDPKMQVFFNEFGGAGYGFFWVVTEQFYLENLAKLSKTWQTWQMLAKLCQVPETAIEKMVNSCLDLGLWQSDKDFFWSQRVNREMENRLNYIEKISNTRKLSGQRGGLAKASKTYQKLAKPTQRRGEEIRGDISIEKNLPPQISYSPNVLMTEKKYLALLARVGEENAQHLIERLERYSGTNKKRFKSYSDHFRVLMTWDQNEREKGKRYYKHPKLGAGYYYEKDIERSEASRENSQRAS